MPESKIRKLVFADVFAGCGGLSLGLFQAGLVGRFAIEHDAFAFETLKANLLSRNSRHRFVWPRWLPKKPMSIATLLNNFHAELLALQGKIDILVGGPPCQGFSSAGRRKHDDPRNQLFASYLDIVDLLKPKAVLIENVRGFTVDFNVEVKLKNYSRELRTRLAEDYEVFEDLLDLSAFGVPQSRTRYFLIALRKDIYNENPFDLLRDRLPSFLRRIRLKVPVNSWSAISDLEVSRGGTRPSPESAGFEEIVYTRPVTVYQKLMGAGETSPSDLRLARHSHDIVCRFREIIEMSHAQGRLNTSLSEETSAIFGLRKRPLRVLDPDRPSPTITSLPDDLLHYREPRALTVRENARLQSFPDWFAFMGKYTTGGNLRRREVPRFTQVANAVPPLAARAFGEMFSELFKSSG
jgi:DNA (cytosine-5)-methyltransferase 1